MNTQDDQDPDLARRLAELPAEVEPRRDLWVGVAPRLEARGRISRIVRIRRDEAQVRRLATAGAVLLAAASVALAFMAPRYAVTAGVATEGAASPVEVAAEPETPPEMEAGAVPGEERYQAAVAALRATFEERAPMLPAADVAKVRASLLAIDAAVAATHEALDLTADDPDLQSELGDEYAQEIQTLNDVLDWTTRS